LKKGPRVGSRYSSWSEMRGRNPVRVILIDPPGELDESRSIASGCYRVNLDGRSHFGSPPVGIGCFDQLYNPLRGYSLLLGYYFETWCSSRSKRSLG
jgi:hypothetical protein